MSDPLAAPSTTPRVAMLDALRGIACMTVVFNHIFFAAPLETLQHIQGTLWIPVIRLFSNGDFAVIIFLLLSGFVLSRPFYAGKKSNYGRFMLKRVCRLYAAYAVTIGLAAWLLPLMHVQQPLEGGSPWLNAYMEQTAAANVPAHFLMIGRTPDMALDGVIWTLIHELRISVIFPLLFLLCRDARVGLAAAVICTFGSTALLKSCGGTEPWVQVDTFGVSLLWTLRLVPYFIVGILLCKHEKTIRGFFKRRQGWERKLFFVFVILTVIFPHSYINPWTDMWFVLMAVTLIIMPFDMPRLKKRLEGPVPQWLGDISYSVYLLHTPVIMILLHMLWGHGSFAAMAVAIVAVTLAGATLMRWAVELPAMRLGRIGIKPLSPRGRG